MGWLKDLTGDYRAGLGLLGVGVVIAAIVAYMIWLQIEKKRRLSAQEASPAEAQTARGAAK
jgi:flagellar biosynthesis/type III secretory pathway M-ring protein FliF/YscJ